MLETASFEGVPKLSCGCRAQFVQRKQRADRAVVSNIFNVSFLCLTFILTYFSLPFLWSAFFLLYHFIEDLTIPFDFS